MVHSKKFKFIAAILVSNRVCQETHLSQNTSTVSLQYGSPYSILVKNPTDQVVFVSVSSGDLELIREFKLPAQSEAKLDRVLTPTALFGRSLIFSKTRKNATAASADDDGTIASNSNKLTLTFFQEKPKVNPELEKIFRELERLRDEKPRRDSFPDWPRPYPVPVPYPVPYPPYFPIQRPVLYCSTSSPTTGDPLNRSEEPQRMNVFGAGDRPEVRCQADGAVMTVSANHRFTGETTLGEKLADDVSVTALSQLEELTSFTFYLEAAEEPALQPKKKEKLKCSHCGKKTKKTAKFCPECGTALVTET